MEVLKPVTFKHIQEEINGLSREYFSYSTCVENQDFALSKQANCLIHIGEEKTEKITHTGQNHLPFSLIVWGCGEFGQHGLNESGDVTIEMALSRYKSGKLMLQNNEFPVTTVCGSSHTLVLTGKGQVYSWGNGTSGQLGNGSCTKTSKPTLIPHPMDRKIRGMACGARHSFIWTKDGCCYSFGNNFNAQLGYNFSKADFKENQLEPVLIELFPDMKVKMVACGARHSLFLLKTGHVMAVGCNQHGQIGNGTTRDAVIPTKLDNISSITHAACGNIHSLVSDENGAVYAWGYGKAFGKKIRNVVTPQQFIPKDKESSLVISLAGGDCHSMVLYDNGVLFTWGNNYEGQLGLGKDIKYQNEPEAIPSDLLPRPVLQIACGEATSAAVVTGNGQLFMWGKNAGLIHSDKKSQYFQHLPHRIEMEGLPVTQISCGAWHVSAIIHNTTNETENSFQHADIEYSEVEESNLTDLEVKLVKHMKPCRDRDNMASTDTTEQLQKNICMAETMVTDVSDSSLDTCFITKCLDTEVSRMGNGSCENKNLDTVEDKQTMYSEEVSLLDMKRCGDPSVTKNDTTSLGNSEFYDENNAACCSDETKHSNLMENLVDHHCKKQSEDSGVLRTQENVFQKGKNHNLKDSVCNNSLIMTTFACSDQEEKTSIGLLQKKTPLTCALTFETEDKIIEGKDTKTSFLQNEKATTSCTSKSRNVSNCDTKDKIVLRNYRRKTNENVLNVDKCEDLLNENYSNFLGNDGEVEEANNDNMKACTNNLEQCNPLQFRQDVYQKDLIPLSSRLSDKKTSSNKDTNMLKYTSGLSLASLEHSSSKKQLSELKQNSELRQAVTSNKYIDFNQVVTRQQTVPVIDLGFGKTLGNISGSREAELSRTKPSFTTFRNVWKASNLFREKQRQKKLWKGTRPESDINLVFNMESMLPNRPTHAVREMNNLTKLKEDLTQVSRTKTDKLSRNNCCNHRGELLPPICSCKKNCALLKKRDAATNVFINRS